MKPKKLKKLLASLSDVPLGCYTTSADHVGWRDLTTEDADAIRNVLADKIRRQERKKARKKTRSDWSSTPDVCIGVEGYIDSVGAFNKENDAQYFERVYGKALSDIADYLRMPGAPTLSADVPNAVRGMVKQADLDRVSLANCREALNDIAAYLDMPAGPTLHADVPNAVAGMVAQVKIDRDDLARNTVKTELDAVVALQECAAHIGMNASVESIPFILDNLPRIVRDLVASRAGGWEGCSSEDAELTRVVTNGGEPRHFRRLRPCSPVISEDAGFYWITWKENGDTLRMFLHRRDPRPAQKLSPEGPWVTLDEDAAEPSPEELSLAYRLEDVADRLGSGELEAGYASGLLDDIAADLRAQKAVQS